jgi:hypothetical protein
MPNSKNKNS